MPFVPASEVQASFLNDTIVNRDKTGDSGGQISCLDFLSLTSLNCIRFGCNHLLHSEGLVLWSDRGEGGRQLLEGRGEHLGGGDCGGSFSSFDSYWFKSSILRYFIVFMTWTKLATQDHLKKQNKLRNR